MSKSLVIVESPAKVKTIGKFLGKNYIIKASMGHVKDLPKSDLGIDVENGFKPKFIVIKQKRKTLKEITEAADNSENIFLATDPDREGEAIAYHLATEIQDEKKPKNIKRVIFNEITKQAVTNAFLTPRDIDVNKVEAQNTRRILDRIVGYKLSPLLWKKVKGGLSAGRVQSVAVRIVCEREAEIEKFKSDEFWSITAKFEAENPPQFLAKLEKYKKEKIKIENEAESNKVLKDLETAEYKVKDVTREEKKRYPSPPFITSTLQQEASRKHSFTVTKTMSVAQGLYEGVDVGEEGPVGLITYMRTDSVTVAKEAQEMARKYIKEKYGENFLPSQPPQYKSKKSAQEAHEAIRPTSAEREPEKIKEYLTSEQYRLYKIIWERFLASQMKPAELDVTTIEIEAQEYLFKTIGSVVKDAGFLIIQEEKKQKEAENDNNDPDEEETKEEQALPSVNKGEELKKIEITPKQNFTKPPPRYSEAGLVKVLEEKGIGRPSTYAPIIQTIQARLYVAKEKQRFHPTELGKIVNDLLVENFPLIIDPQFTANMEEELDEIEEGKVKWAKAVEDFYTPFMETLLVAQDKIQKVKREEKFSGKNCPKCNSPMVEREGRFGKFFACSGFPKCKYTESSPLDIKCPIEGCGGDVVLLRTKKGRIFYGCSNYPKCKFMSWQKPGEKITNEESQQVDKSTSEQVNK